MDKPVYGRENWIDVARCLAIYAVYIGHFGADAGRLSPFVFSFHIPLFFLLAGCTFFFEKEKHYGMFVWKKICSILVPMWIFSLLAIGLYVFQYGITGQQLKEFLWLIIKGNIRNTFISNSLWFLSCLFVIEIVFKLLCYARSKIVLLVFCLGCFFVANCAFAVPPVSNPRWIYNIDSALHYAVFFGSGYVLYPFLSELMKLDTGVKKRIFFISMLLSGIFTALVYVDPDSVYQLMYRVPCSFLLTYLLTPMLISTFIVLASKVLENAVLLANIGKETLFLCGNEYFLIILLPEIVGILGFEMHMTSPVQVILWGCVKLGFGYFLLIPAERKIVEWLQNLFCQKRSKCPQAFSNR